VIKSFLLRFSFDIDQHKLLSSIDLVFIPKAVIVFYPIKFIGRVEDFSFIKN